MARSTVRVAHGLGHAGRARAEDQHGLVVGVAPRRRRGRDRSTRRTRSSTVAVSSRSITSATPRRRPSSATASPSATACTGAVSASAWSTSTAFHAGLSSTAAAPSLADAVRPRATNSTRLVVMTATRSPAPMPRAVQVVGEARCCARRGPAKDQWSSPARIASRSPSARPRPAPSPWCMRAASAPITETFFSEIEIDVNH